MKIRIFLLSAFLATSLLCFATANGSWLKKVPEASHNRVNPYAGNSEAVAAGANFFHNNCARCHGNDAQGKGSRPSLKSDRIRNASDGDIAWLLKNGEVYKGMPNWSGLSEQKRWQIITYIRSLNTPPTEAQ